MQWQPDTAFLQGLDFFSGAVAELGDAAWQRTSPCADWRALDVLGHVGQATRFGTLLLQGAQPAWAPVEPPGAAVDGTPGECGSNSRTRPAPPLRAQTCPGSLTRPGASEASQ